MGGQEAPAHGFWGVTLVKLSDRGNDPGSDCRNNCRCCNFEPESIHLLREAFFFETLLRFSSRASSSRTDFVLGWADIIFLTRSRLCCQVRGSSKIALIRSI